MSHKEIIRLYVIQSAVEGEYTVRQAAGRLALSTRRVKQLKKEFLLRGASSHNNIGCGLGCDFCAGFFA